MPKNTWLKRASMLLVLGVVVVSLTAWRSASQIAEGGLHSAPLPDVSQVPGRLSGPVTGSVSAHAFKGTLGKPFVLQIDQSATVNGITVTFNRVTEDSRCPINAQCVWVGRAKVSVTVTLDGRAPETYELNLYGGRTGPERSEIEIGGHVVRFLALDPNRAIVTSSAQAPPSRTYTATFVVDKASK